MWDGAGWDGMGLLSFGWRSARVDLELQDHPAVGVMAVL